MARGNAAINTLRRRLTLQAPVSTPDNAGGNTTSFVTVASIWAEVVWLSGEERLRADRPEQAGRYQITLRWRAGIDAGMRFADGPRVFGILSAGDPLGNRTRLVCLCEEISP